ncbi:MAG: DUF11 domain-containing protein [Anaerolineales bacterium]|nr:DUF11 domain-containing protein [Anaerolineales bacterium]
MVKYQSNTVKVQQFWVVLSSAALALLTLGFFLWMFASPQAVKAATQTVTNTNDSGSGSLRQAIADANPGDTITFDSSLSGQTITLASTLEISQDVTIDGSDLITPVIVSGNDSVRVFYIYTDTTVTFDSLTIANGNISTPEMSGYYAIGGGLKIEPGASVTLTHSTIFSNTATHYDSGMGLYMGLGGGIFNRGTLMVIDTTFSDNIIAPSSIYGDGYGGAIYNGGNLQVTDSIFSENYAISGAGISSSGGGMFNIQNSRFTGNASPCGGAGVLNDSGNAIINESIISDNLGPGTWCEGSAAGIGNRYGTMTVTHSIISGNISDNEQAGISNYDGDLIVMDSAIYNNVAGGHGGGIYNWYQAALTVINCTIYNNTANYGGGGIYSGPDEGASLTLINSTLFSNTAQYGGAIYNGAPGYTGTAMTLVNSTIVSNTATNSGGGLYNRDAIPTLNNAIFWGNSAPSGSQVFNYTSNIPNISYSNIQDSGGSGGGWDTALGVDGGGNVDVDPLFVDASTGNLHLQLTSLVNDAGNNNLVPVGITTDLDGAPRFMDVPGISDTGSGTMPIVDMGAYENGPALTLEKLVEPETGLDGSVVTYTLNLSNTGTMSDSNLSLIDELPSGVDFGGWVSQPGGMIQATNTLTWTGTMNAGEGITAVFTATVNGNPGVIDNTAFFNGIFQSGYSSALFSIPGTENIYIYLPIIVNQ